MVRPLWKVCSRILQSISHKIKYFQSKPFSWSNLYLQDRRLETLHCGVWVDGSMYVQCDIQSLSEVDRDTLLPVLVVSGTPIRQAGWGGRGGGRVVNILDLKSATANRRDDWNWKELRERERHVISQSGLKIIQIHQILNVRIKFSNL